jgi:hypothetical protein
MMIQGADEQRAYLDYVALHDSDTKPREVRIREAAAEVIRRAETYTPAGMTIVVKTDTPRVGWQHEDRLPMHPYMGWRSINVRLVPELQGSLDVAQVLAEAQIRPEWP